MGIDNRRIDSLSVMRICECEHALIEHSFDECSRCDCKAYRDDSGPIDFDWFAGQVAEVLATLPQERNQC